MNLFTRLRTALRQRRNRKHAEWRRRGKVMFIGCGPKADARDWSANFMKSIRP